MPFSTSGTAFFKSREMFHVKKIKTFDFLIGLLSAVVGVGSLWFLFTFAREIWLLLNFVFQTFALSFFCSVFVLFLESGEKRRKKKKHNFNTHKKNEQINKFTFDRVV